MNLRLWINEVWVESTPFFNLVLTNKETQDSSILSIDRDYHKCLDLALEIEDLSEGKIKYEP